MSNIQGRMSMQVSRDDEGYLTDPDNWNEDIAKWLANEENVELKKDSWTAIEFMRNYYTENSIIPDVRHVVKHLASELDLDKKESKKLIFSLFPHGYVKQACKIAGMKRPRGWSTG